MPKNSCMRCYISGRVQGVWFRASAKEHADHLGVRGWAKNLSDGRVDVLACGDDEQLEAFYSWLKHGPELAVVTDASREDLPWQECHGFDTL